MKNNSMMVTIVIAVVVGAAAFFGGMQYQKSQAAGNGTYGPMMQNGQFMRNGQGGQRRIGANGAIAGQIVSATSQSITIKLRDGSSKIVNLNSSTKITKTDTAATSDLKSGENVAAFGTPNSDGSITAQDVTLNPGMRVFGGPRPSEAPNPSQSNSQGY